MQPFDPTNVSESVVEQLVRALVSRGQTCATYVVLDGAVRAAISVTAVRSDGLVEPSDVLAVLRTACQAVVAVG